jgi:hypothetical protein
MVGPLQLGGDQELNVTLLAMSHAVTELRWSLEESKTVKKARFDIDSRNGEW